MSLAVAVGDFPAVLTLRWTDVLARRSGQMGGLRSMSRGKHSGFGVVDLGHADRIRFLASTNVQATACMRT
jgi:hypothetical protein